MVGHRLGVVSRAGGNHPPLSLLWSELEELVQSSTILEGSGALQVLELEVKPARNEVFKGMGVLARSVDHATSQTASRSVDVG
jgi:hypothetical protein